ncbi:MAG: sugar kinase [Bacteroidales bacterium]|nr:sugar kinase [Bacteroidales bacterium]
MKTIVTFGEIMGRFNTDGFQRLRQCMPGSLNLTFAGAEANVAASVAILGGKAKFVTALPDNDITGACISNLKGLNVDVSQVKKVDYGRMGLYFVERGANQRPGRVIYDREYSSVSLTPGSSYNWEEIFAGAGWFHITGITPALSEISAATSLTALKEAKKRNLKVSCDLNFRKKLWRWKEGMSPENLAQETMRKMIPYIDLVIANEEDAHDVLGITAGNTDVHKGKLDVEKYTDVAREIIRQFPNVDQVAITLRESISATHNNWGAMLFDSSEGKAFFAPMENGKYTPFEIKSIVDRIGGGDSFGAGLIFALNTPGLSGPATAIEFAASSSCLCHSIEGDYNYVSRAEVESLMKGSKSGRVIR